MSARKAGGWTIVLTSDRGSFSEYSRSVPLGYFACMPAHVVPRLFMDRLFTPPVETAPDGEATVAPYALRKVEGALHAAGLTSVACVPPEHLPAVVGPSTRILGVTAHDPYGFSPVSTKLTMLFGGGPAWNARFFTEFGALVQRLKERHPLTVIAGGPGIWQMSYRVPEWVDTVFQGEAEVDFPILCRTVLAGETPPPFVTGRSAKLEEIPRILKRSRFGEVQVTRGCPRGCEFCSITPEKYRTIPLEEIKAEIAVNMAAGESMVDLITDDILLYGASKLRANHEAVVRLYTEVAKMGATTINFDHVSAPAVRESPQTVLAMGEIGEYDKHPGQSPVVGMETGSERIFHKYMPAKSFPWKAADWWDVILSATTTMNQANIWPCYTMTIGFPDETDADVDRSIGLVQAIIDQDLKAWIFPLPVIPISTTRLKGNPMPELERLPDRYWDLLALAWKRDLALARVLTPTVTARMTNPIARRLVTLLTNRMTRRIEKVFEELQRTRGRKSRDYESVDLDNPVGIARSVLYMARISVAG